MTSSPRPAAVAGVLGLSLCAAATAAPVPDWSGRWQGELVNLPLRAGAPSVTVRAEIGPWPSAGSCSIWRRSFESTAHPPMTKDYLLCRSQVGDDLYIDERDGVKLAAQLVGDTLLTPFKYGKLILLASTRLRGDVLEEEIVTVDDKPAVDGPLPLVARGVQRISLRRVTP